MAEIAPVFDLFVPCVLKRTAAEVQMRIRCYLGSCNAQAVPVMGNACHCDGFRLRCHGQDATPTPLRINSLEYTITQFQHTYFS